MSGADRGAQLGWAMGVGLVLAWYLTLAGIALETRRSIPHAAAAALVSIPLLALGFVAWLMSLTAAVAVMGFAAPVALVFAAVYLFPPLSFIQEWPGEVIAAVTMPFVVLWWMLLEHAGSRLAKSQTSPTQQEPQLRRQRLGQHLVRILLGVLEFLSQVIGRLRSPESRLGRWLVVPAQMFPFVVATLGALFPLVPLVLIDWYVFGGDYSAIHDPSLLAATTGLVVGGGYGAGVGFVALLASASIE